MPEFTKMQQAQDDSLRPLAGYGFTPDLRFDRRAVNRHDAGTCDVVQVFLTYV